jgi:hypothetical protein
VTHQKISLELDMKAELRLTLRRVLKIYFHLPSLKGTAKFHPRTGHEDPEGKYSYGSTLSLTSPYMGVGDERHAQAVLSTRPR